MNKPAREIKLTAPCGHAYLDLAVAAIVITKIGAAVPFKCTCCGAEQTLRIYQHKGELFLEWAR